MILDEKSLELKIASEMNKCGSDKQSDHNYSTGYVSFLKRINSLNNINFLEIGITNTIPDKSSLHGWSKIFDSSNIYGIDIVPEKMIDEKNIKTFIANQNSIVDLSKFMDYIDYAKFDVILDDGSHIFKHAKTSFEYLFKYLKNDGIYMIEDIWKTNNIPGWASGQQTVEDWNNFLSRIENIEYEIIDCQPERIDYNSVLIGIWRK